MSAGTKAMLFGGNDNYSGFYGDTWIYDASTHVWYQHNSTGVAGIDKPEARLFVQLSWAGGSTVVLFGGYLSGSVYASDTWLYDLGNYTWTKLTIAGVEGTDFPEQRYGGSLGYAGGTSVVLFGGFCISIYYHNTWVFDTASTKWTQFNSTGGENIDFPARRYETTLAGNGSGTLMLFGGSDPTLRSDTWEYK